MTRQYERRGTARERGYNTRWEKARATHLRNNPLCVLCDQVGKVTAATIVDHIVPHRRDQRLFWDRTNWQSLCVACHNAVKQAEERGSGLRGCDEEGNPLDQRHRWNR